MDCLWLGEEFISQEDVERNGDHPYKNLAKNGYKPNMKYIFSNQPLIFKPH